jgi:hypothetical protein
VPVLELLVSLPVLELLVSLLSVLVCKDRDWRVLPNGAVSGVIGDKLANDPFAIDRGTVNTLVWLFSLSGQPLRYDSTCNRSVGCFWRWWWARVAVRSVVRNSCQKGWLDALISWKEHTLHEWRIREQGGI